VLDAVVKLDEDALMDHVIDVEVSMCGVASTYIVIHAAKKLGANTPNCSTTARAAM